MRIRAERDELADAFGRASRALAARPSLPILQGLLCEAVGNRLQVTGTDLEITVRTAVPVEVMEEGRSVIHGRLLTDAVRRMPAGPVVVSASDGEVHIEGRGPEYTLRPLDLADYPTIGDEVGEGVVVEGSVLGDALAQAVVASSTDGGRPILTAVLFESSEDGLRLVSTDSYRLAVRDLRGVGLAQSGLVPARGLREMGRTVGAESVTVAIADREAVFTSDRGMLRLRLIEGSFPPYRKLLRDDYPNQVIVDKTDVLEALNRVALVAEDHIPVRLAISSGGVDVTVTRQDVGSETEHFSGEYKGEDESVSIAFNPRYLADGVAAIPSDRIRFLLVDGLKPAVIDDPDDDTFLYLLMPVRV